MPCLHPIKSLHSTYCGRCRAADRLAHQMTNLHGGQEMERRTVELQTENECLRRIGTLHMQRCLLLEDICYKNGLHVPGGLVVHHKQ